MSAQVLRERMIVRNVDVYVEEVRGKERKGKDGWDEVTMTGGRHGSHRHYMRIMCLCAMVGACVAINATAAEKASPDNSYLCVVGCLLYIKRRKREE